MNDAYRHRLRQELPRLPLPAILYPKTIEAGDRTGRELQERN